LAGSFSNARHVGIHASAEPLSHAGQDTIPPRSRRGEDQGSLGGLADGYRGQGIGSVTRLAEIHTSHTEVFCGRASGDRIRSGLDLFTDQSNDQARTDDSFVQSTRGVQGFKDGARQRAVGFGVSK
jgi:hypothetical protein